MINTNQNRNRAGFNTTLSRLVSGIRTLTLYLLRAFAFLKRFSGYTRAMGFRDSIFNVTINSAAVLKHPRLKFTGNVILEVATTEEHN